MGHVTHLHNEIVQPTHYNGWEVAKEAKTRLMHEMEKVVLNLFIDEEFQIFPGPKIVSTQYGTTAL